ncbi:MAG TPA: hypothetical protein VMZ90_11815 [Vicinamibacterales bacterium]|nr:hypothetical protein [Vicinamibacterales bacterium]
MTRSSTSRSTRRGDEARQTEFDAVLTTLSTQHMDALQAIMRGIEIAGRSAALANTN